MKEICVIGAGEAGVSFIRQIRSKNQEVPLTLIEKNRYFLSKREIFDWMSNKKVTSLTDLEEFCREYNVQFVNNKVQKIDTKKRTVLLKGREEKIPFSQLIVASGLKSKSLFLKGEFRQGVFYLSELVPHEVRDLLKISHHLVIFASTLMGIKLGFILASLGKDIKLIVRDLDYLGDFQEKLIGALKEKRIDLYLGCHLEEIIGESMVKATRISLPKIFASELVFIDSGFIPNRDIFLEELRTEKDFFTQFEDIFLLGDVRDEEVEKEKFLAFRNEEVKKESQALARYLLGESSLPYSNYSRRKPLLREYLLLFERIFS